MQTLIWIARFMLFQNPLVSGVQNFSQHKKDSFIKETRIFSLRFVAPHPSNHLVTGYWSTLGPGSTGNLPPPPPPRPPPLGGPDGWGVPPPNLFQGCQIFGQVCLAYEFSQWVGVSSPLPPTSHPTQRR